MASSKEALKRIIEFLKINQEKSNVMYGYVDINDINIIKQDLDRLEKLEKVIEKIKNLPNCDICDANWHKGCMCLQNKLKKAFEILKENHEIALHYGDEFPTPMISINGVYSYINEEKYELLKEVLNNE